MDNIRQLKTLIFIKRKDGQIHCNVPRVVTHHSPDGFEFGYLGSGPADLALNILSMYLIPEEDNRVACYEGICHHTAWKLHQKFKEEFIAPEKSDVLEIRSVDIINWIREQLNAN